MLPRQKHAGKKIFRLLQEPKWRSISCDRGMGIVHGLIVYWDDDELEEEEERDRVGKGGRGESLRIGKRRRRASIKR